MWRCSFFSAWGEGRGALLALRGKGPGVINVMQGTVFHKEHNRDPAEKLLSHQALFRSNQISGPNLVSQGQLILSISGNVSDTLLPWTTVPISFHDSLSLLSDGLGQVHLHLSTLYKTPG